MSGASKQAWLFVAMFSLGFGELFAAPPELTYFFPPGAKRGTTATVAAAGKAGTGSLRVWVEGAGLDFEPAKATREFSLRVAADAVPGVRLARLVNDEGASACRPLVVGTLDELAEKEPNDAPGAPQRITATAITVNGALQKSGDVDGFGVELSPGQTLVASVDAHELLGSPMDSVLQLVDSAGNVLAQNHDDRGLDPRLIFTATRGGPYIVRLFAFPSNPDQKIIFSGAATYVYRLTLTTGGYLDYAFPLAVTAGTACEVELCGWNIPRVASKHMLPALVPGEVRTVFDPRLAGTATVAAVSHAAIIEAEPNDRDATAVSVPISISGRIDRPGDVDAFVFTAKKGQQLACRATARRLGFLLDPALKILDARGKQLTQADDVADGRDAELSFTVPADGAYRVQIGDFAGQAGPRHVYRLDIVPDEPDFELKLSVDSLTIAPGKPAELKVEIERRRGFATEIAFTATNLPKGVTLEPISSPGKGDAAKKLALKFSAASGASSGAVRIVGKASGGRTHTASAPVAGLSMSVSDVWLAVTGGDAKPADVNPVKK